MMRPQIVGDWWTIAGTPDLGVYKTAEQQTMDFGIWRAADGTWQLGACIRRTGCGGKGRLLFRWQSDELTDHHWTPQEIMLEADSGCGETIGGLQAPFVHFYQNRYVMFYGDWVNICRASSINGKNFSRDLNDENTSSCFNEGDDNNTRDPMLMRHNGIYYLYYTGVCNRVGAIYCRTSLDLMSWSDSVVVSRGGRGGNGSADAECAFVIFHADVGRFILLRWHSSGVTSIYSSPDPLDFGVDDDRYIVGELPLEVARIISWENQSYIASLHSDYSGIRLARMKWVST